MRRSLLALTALLAIATAAPTLATVRNDPVKLRCAGPAPVLEPGKTVTIPVELVVAKRVTISALEVKSASLSRAFARRAAPLTLDAGASHRFEIEVTPTERPEPLVFRYEVDGVPLERTVDLTPRLAGEIAKRRAMIQIVDAPPPVPAQPMTRTRPRDPATSARPEPGKSGGPAVSGYQRDIIVAGRIVYYRDDGEMVGADHMWVRIMDEDNIYDQTLYSGYTDNQGNFFFQFLWTAEDAVLDGDPELYVLCETQSPEVRVQSAFFEVDYSWETSVHEEHDIYWNIGTWTPADQSEVGAMHIYTNIQHNWDWYWYQQDYSVPTVDVQWPDGGGTYYHNIWEEIHVGLVETWFDDAHAHEYGHHFVNNYANVVASDFCNGFCDDNGCSHCLWCPETEHSAFSEGWPDWIAEVQTRSYRDTYGVASRQGDPDGLERILGCFGAYPQEAHLTEGYFAAILYDLWDTGYESAPGGIDAVSIGTEEIFEVLDLDQPVTAVEFLTDLKTRFPQYTADVWQAAKNNFLNLDTEPPTVPTNLVSTSHTPGVPLMNAQVVLNWSGSTDDWAGVAGYDLLIDYPSPQPDVTFNLSASTLAGTGYLPPGTYTLGIRARDQVGHTSAYTMSGPYVIIAPDPQNLTFAQPPGWADALVPRPTDDATGISVPLPTSLAGNSPTTYLNMALMNNGQTVPNLIFATHTFYVDAVGGNSFNASPGPGVTAARINRGPVTVRGGRHVLAGYLDIFAAWPELNEYDNTWGQQWVWSPLALAPQVPVRRAAPPGATDGWLLTQGAFPLYYNCDGLRMSGSGWWNATWIAADQDTADYDLRVHPVMAGVVDGFSVPMAMSSRGAGELDLIVINRHVLAGASWDVGATSSAGDMDTYVARHIESLPFAFGDSLAIAWPDSQYALIREVNIAGGDLGFCAATATGDPADGPFWIALLERTFTSGGLNDGRITLHPSDANGRARVEFNATTAGDVAVLLVRDPVHGRGARTTVLDVERTPPNLAFEGAAGWHAPLVPRPAQDGTVGSVPMPDTLDGTAYSTYLNLRIGNLSTVAPPFGTGYQVRVDGVSLFSSILPAIAGGEASAINVPSPVLVLGGRHTLTGALDPVESLEELEEYDNVWGEQWVWGPYQVPAEQPLAWGPPPARTGGWADVRSGEPLLFNTLGMRLPLLEPGHTWGAVAVMPGPGSDVDVQLHAPASGVKDGFDAPLAVSAWGESESEFVLFNIEGTPPRQYDVGIVNVNGVAQGPNVLFTQGAPRGVGTIGPLSLGINRTLDLHEVTLPTGHYLVRLTNHTAGPNLGVSVHDPSFEHQTRSQALQAAWALDPVDEFVFAAPVEGTYAIAVWKPTRADLSFSADYTLEIEATTVAAEPSDAPARNALRFAAPNPFASSTAIAFDLAAGGNVELEVFDVTGARVATLARGYWTAGQHRVVWDGHASGGRPAPAGVYLVRLTTPGAVATRRVARLP